MLVRLPIAIRRVWHDRFQGRETITIRIVRPSPLADPDGSRKFHIIAELNRPVVTPLQPMLVALRQITSQGVGAPVWCVSLFPARFTSDDIRNECAQHCERHHLLIPLYRWPSQALDVSLQRETIHAGIIPTLLVRFETSTGGCGV